MPIIQTISGRLGVLKKVVIGTGITVVLAVGGVSGDYYLNPTEKLPAGMVQRDGKMTKNEYVQLRGAIVEIRKGEVDLVQQDLWVSILAKEKERCGGATIHNITIENWIEKNNLWLEDVDLNGCPN